MKARRRGFTLVETLAVVAVIGLLASIAFAISGPARERARISLCMSNLRQIGHAIEMYRQDYSGADPELGVRMDWARLGLPDDPRVLADSYLHDRRVLFCPDYAGQVAPADRLNTTYEWRPDPDAVLPPGRDFSAMIARRGAESAIVTCQWHNGFDVLAPQPRWTLKRVIVLRVNGSVESELVPVYGDGVEW